jgi:Rod binding domain-containing protein
MRPIDGTRTPAAPDPVQGPDKVREAAAQLSGLFARQLFAAMRATVPTDGPFGGGSGGALFTTMLDEHLADTGTARWTQRLGDAIARSMRAGPSGATPSAPPEPPR